MSIFNLDQAIIDDIIEHDHHFHCREVWFGKVAVQTTANWGSSTTMTPFTVLSGNNAFSTASTSIAQVLGTSDTPLKVGHRVYDAHRVFVVAVSTKIACRLRFVYGNGTLNAAIGSSQYSQTMIKFDSANPQQSAGSPFDIHMPRIPVGYKLWAQCKSTALNTSVSFFIGVHGYPKAKQFS